MLQPKIAKKISKTSILGSVATAEDGTIPIISGSCLESGLQHGGHTADLIPLKLVRIILDLIVNVNWPLIVLKLRPNNV